MATLRGIYPRYIVDFEAEKAALIVGNPNGTQITVRSNGGRDYVLTDGVWVPTGKVLKNYTASEPESINTTTTYVAKLTTVFNVTEAVEFQLTWSYEQSNATNNRDNEVQVLIDGVEVNYEKVTIGSNSSYIATANFINQILAVGAHTIIIQFRRVTGSAKIRRCRLDISKT